MGGQVGHQDSTLKMVEDPEHGVIYHLKTGQGCGGCLENVEPQKMIRRQVFDIR